MAAIVIIGVIIAAPAWYIYISTPNWLLWGPPSFMETILELLREPYDLLGWSAMNQLRDYSLIAGIIGTAMVVVPILYSMAKRR